MQQCREPYSLASSRRLAHGCQPIRRGIPAQCPGRGCLTAVPLGRGPSLHGLRRGNALIVRPLHRYYSLVRLLIRVHAHRSAFAFMGRSGALPDTDEASQVPCRELLHALKVSDCARFCPCKPFAMRRCCLLSPARDRHLGIGPVSQLNTWLVVAPVNASRLSSRTEPRASLGVGAVG